MIGHRSDVRETLGRDRTSDCLLPSWVERSNSLAAGRSLPSGRRAPWPLPSCLPPSALQPAPARVWRDPASIPQPVTEADALRIGESRGKALPAAVPTEARSTRSSRVVQPRSQPAVGTAADSRSILSRFPQAERTPTSRQSSRQPSSTRQVPSAKPTKLIHAASHRVSPLRHFLRAVELPDAEPRSRCRSRSAGNSHAAVARDWCAAVSSGIARDARHWLVQSNALTKVALRRPQSGSLVA